MPDPASKASCKASLRAALKSIRSELPPLVRRQAALAVAEKGVGFLKPYPPSTIAGYYPVGSEIDPRPLMQDLERRGHRLALPVVVQKDAPLHFRAWSITDPLRDGAYDIPVPQDDSPLVTPDICLVPGLGFDQNLQRLGYGGGYYDRTLRGLITNNPRFAPLGIAFSAQIVDSVGSTEFDIPMAAVISEVGISLPAG